MRSQRRIERRAGCGEETGRRVDIGLTVALTGTQRGLGRPAQGLGQTERLAYQRVGRVPESLDLGRDAIGVPLLGGWRGVVVGVQLQHGDGDLVARYAVDSRVVHLGEHSDVAALEPFDDPALPQRPVAFQVELHEMRRELGQLLRAPGRRNGDVP